MKSKTLPILIPYNGDFELTAKTILFSYHDALKIKGCFVLTFKR